MEWKTIASAPKDGSRFWGLIDSNAITMFWHPDFKEFVSSYRRMTMAPGLTINGKPHEDHSPEIHKPNMWMPIIYAPL